MTDHSQPSASHAPISLAGPAHPNAKISDLMLLAARHITARNFDEAEKVCRIVLSFLADYPPAVHFLGLIAAGRRDYAEAEKQLRRAIRLAPFEPSFLSNLGNILRVKGDGAGAEAAYREALALKGDYPDAKRNLALLLEETGRPDAAVGLLRELAQAMPGDAEIRITLATALISAGRFEESLSAAKEAENLAPSNARISFARGKAFVGLGLLDKALEEFIRASVLAPRMGEAYAAMARILATQRKADFALQAAQKANSLLGDSPDMDIIIGVSLYDLARPEDAVAIADKILAQNPDHLDALHLRGAALRNLGRIDESRDSHTRALALDPDDVQATSNLIWLDPVQEGSAALVNLRRLGQKAENYSGDARIQLEFALGKAHDDLGEFDRAFPHFREANGRKRAQIAYDEKAESEFFDRITSVFSAEFVSAKSGKGSKSALPIFIVGMPRSGTTLVEQVLASHPEVAGGGEMLEFSGQFLELRRLRGTEKYYPEFARDFEDADFAALGDGYVERVKKRHPGAARVTDKLPANFLWLGLIHLSLPSAVIIHCRRDPLDACFSHYMRLFDGPQNYAYDLGELGRYYRKYHALMRHWASVFPANRFLDVAYEDFVNDLETGARRILDFCNLPWDSRCLDFQRTRRAVYTMSAAQIRRPLYKSAVGHARNYLPYLGELVGALGDLYDKNY